MPEEMPEMDIQRTAPVDEATLRILLNAEKRPKYTRVVQGGVEIQVRLEYDAPHLRPHQPHVAYDVRLTMPWELVWLQASQMYQRPWDPKDVIREILPFVIYESHCAVDGQKRDDWTGTYPHRTPEELAAHAVFLIECDTQNGWGKYFEPYYQQWLIRRSVNSSLKPPPDSPGMEQEPIL